MTESHPENRSARPEWRPTGPLAGRAIASDDEPESGADEHAVYAIDADQDHEANAGDYVDDPTTAAGAVLDTGLASGKDNV